MLTFLTLFAATQPQLPASEQQAQLAPSPPRRWRLQADLGGRYNPLGVKFRIGAIYRREYGEPPRLNLPRPYLQGGFAASISPASAMASLHAEWMHLPFLVLRAQGDLYRYLGAYGALLEFPDKKASFGDAAMDAASGHELSRFGGRVLLQPTLRAKLGRIIVQNQTELAWYAFGSGGPYFYEHEYDTLLKDGDGLVANRTVVLAQLWASGPDAKLLVGPAYEVQRTFVGGLQRQRLGGALLFCPTAKLGYLARPRLVFQMGVNLQDRNRDGQLFLAGAISADFDL